jgi:ankyrin repeat protein
MAGRSTLMHGAAKFGRVEVIRLLHSLGADVNTPDDSGDTPLHLAALGDHEVAVRTLHSLGAVVNQPNKPGRRLSTARRSKATTQPFECCTRSART